MSTNGKKDEEPTGEPAEKTALELNIEIDPDGRVVFTDLPPDLIDVVLALDPDAVIACSADNAPDDPPSKKSDEPTSR